ncbi:MAG: hypothetical protein ACJAVX_002758 [Pseudoalteromonas rhizosphaerae]|jgi:hypothetical protein
MQRLFCAWNKRRGESWRVRKLKAGLSETKPNDSPTSLPAPKHVNMHCL